MYYKQRTADNHLLRSRILTSVINEPNGHKTPISVVSFAGETFLDEYLQTPPIPAKRPPPDIISYAVWIYYRFNLSHRDVEDLLAERGIIVTRESIRLWCIKFGTI